MQYRSTGTDAPDSGRIKPLQSNRTRIAVAGTCALIALVVALFVSTANGRAETTTKTVPSEGAALVSDLPLAQLGIPTNPAVQSAVLKVRKYSPKIGWYVSAKDFAIAMGSVSSASSEAIPGLSEGVLESSDLTAADGPDPAGILAPLDITTPTTVTANGARLWGNVDSEGHAQPPLLSPEGGLASGTRIGWRYNYDSNYADVLWYQPSIWGFMLRASIACCKNNGEPN